MKLLLTIVVTFFAGMGAGLGTGFAGMSAAAVISPMLITFLGMDPYMAVGIALSSDVLASAVSATGHLPGSAVFFEFPWGSRSVPGRLPAVQCLLPSCSLLL